MGNLEIGQKVAVFTGFTIAEGTVSAISEHTAAYRDKNGESHTAARIDVYALPDEWARLAEDIGRHTQVMEHRVKELSCVGR